MITQSLYERYLDLLLQGDRAGCGRIVQALLDRQIAIRALYTDLFQKSLYAVGELWENNRISVAREHLATAITEGLLHLVYPRLFGGERRLRKAVVSCAANEWHQVGGKMAADIFELNGWDGYFLGANTPVADLVALIDEIRPELVGLSLSIAANMPSLEAGIDAVRADFPRLDLLVGGQAFRLTGSGMLKRFAAVEYVPSLEALETLIGSHPK